jgi:hypothetical protein
VDKLFVGGGADLMCLMNGRCQFQHFPMRYITNAVVTRGNGDGWKLPMADSSGASSLFSLSLYSFYAHTTASPFYTCPGMVNGEVRLFFCSLLRNCFSFSCSYLPLCLPSCPSLPPFPSPSFPSMRLLCQLRGYESLWTLCFPFLNVFLFLLFSLPQGISTSAPTPVVRGTALLLLSSSSGDPLLINLDSGKFLDLPCGDDFNRAPVVVQAADTLSTQR